MEIKDCKEVLYEINKSKFIGYAYNVDSFDKVEEILSSLRTLHEKATHVCYACVISSPQTERCSDDGEPDGTAGRPILDVLKKNNITNVLVVVVRYFGGIKLGAGGLVRAYSTSAKMTIDQCEKVEYENYYEYTISTGLNNKNTLLRIKDKYNFEITSQIYSLSYDCVVLHKADKGDIYDVFLSNNINVIDKKEIRLPKR